MTYLVKNKKLIIDFVFLMAVSAFVLGIIWILCQGDITFGYTTDWASQHAVLPDYFRQTFYETGDLFPDFNLKLGAGQNAYNFSYYGFLNPVILISYFLPFVDMVEYVMVSSIVLIIISIVMFFIWMKLKDWNVIGDNKRAGNKYIPYVTTFMFACSSPLVFHSHMQVMFVDYLPFLLLAFIGVDRLMKNGKSGLVSIGVTCTFLTSYYFAYSGMFALTIYMVYKLISERESNSNFDVKAIRNKCFKYCLSVIIGGLMAAALLLPTLVALINGRGEGATGSAGSAEDILSFIPGLSLSTTMYNAYGMGLTGIAVIAFVSLILFAKKNSIRFLSGAITLIVVSPLLIYILNGFLYIRTKALIPFLPIALFLVGAFLAQNFGGLKKVIITCVVSELLILSSIIKVTNIEIVFVGLADVLATSIMLILCTRVKRRLPLVIFASIISVTVIFEANFNDKVKEYYLTDENYENYYNQDRAELIENTLEQEEVSETSIYRSGSLNSVKYTVNNMYGPNYFTYASYSSVTNQPYMGLCNNDIQINNPTVNAITVVNTSDILFNKLMGVKYLTGKDYAPAGYEKIASKGEYNVYKNENVNSLAFAQTNILSYDTYMSLSPEDKETALLDYVVTGENEGTQEYDSIWEKVDIDTSMGLEKNEDGYYSINTKNGKFQYTIEIPDSLSEYVYVVKCHIKEIGDHRATIRINGTQNSLSGLDSAFPNTNYDFKFVLSDNSENTYGNTLNVVIPEKIKFEFSELEVYRAKIDVINEMGQDRVDMENVKFTGNDTITGNIDTETDSVLTTTIPYDETFDVYVDGVKTDYYKVDNAFIGFDLTSGHHEIKMVYKAKWALAGRVVSVLGIILFIITAYVTKATSVTVRRSSGSADGTTVVHETMA